MFSECDYYYLEERTMLPLYRAARGKQILLTVRYHNPGRQLEDLGNCCELEPWILLIDCIFNSCRWLTNDWLMFRTVYARQWDSCLSTKNSIYQAEGEPLLSQTRNGNRTGKSNNVKPPKGEHLDDSKCAQWQLVLQWMNLLVTGSAGERRWPEDPSEAGNQRQNHSHS